MTTTARSLLERLVDWRHDTSAVSGVGERTAQLNEILLNIEAYLASTKDAPVADGRVSIRQFPDGSWRVQHAPTPGGRWHHLLVRIPVPRHIYDPPVVTGEVVEDK